MPNVNVIDAKPRIDAIATYLCKTFAGACIDRYDDAGRNVVGFRFIGRDHGNVEFSSELLESLPTDEAGVAEVLHLRHAAAEIFDTPRGERIVFTPEGQRRERI
jgi:hypothetical protein